MTKCNCKECERIKQETKDLPDAFDSIELQFWLKGRIEVEMEYQAKLQKAMKRIEVDGSTEKYADTWIIKEKAIQILKEECFDGN